MVEISDLDGVGPARNESLVDAGYEDVDAIAEADPEQLAEDIDVPDDTALDFVVQAQNAVEDDEEDESEAESDSTPDVEDDTITNDEAPEDESEAADDDADEEAVPETLPEEESGEESSDDEPDVIEFTLSFDEPLQYDTFFDAALETRANYYRTNRTGVEAYEHALEQLRNATPADDVEFHFTPAQLNDLHNAIRERSISYKGDNLIDHMDALNSVLQQVEEVRNEHLF